MDEVRIVFSRNHNLGSLALRTALWGAWSHCSIIDGDEVVEASPFYGVRTRPFMQLIRDSSKSEIIAVPVRNSQAVIDAARSQLGHKYDWLGVAGFATRQKWQKSNRWFCSELIAWAFEEAGHPLFLIKPYRITPRDLYIPDWGRV